MKKILFALFVCLGFATAQDGIQEVIPSCADFDQNKAALPVIKAHAYSGSVVVKKLGNLYKLGVPWEKVPSYPVQRIEIIPTRGRDVGQDFAYTDSGWCFPDPQVKFAEFDGKRFWISFPKWMLNGGCYEALVYRFGPENQFFERRQYSFCFNP